ncbi:hypothetical protein scyTo_0018049, partial [Scyliorhinus torazame]|nr:hypothetical protein [Scyliorhinus torazame]
PRTLTGLRVHPVTEECGAEREKERGREREAVNRAGLTETNTGTRTHTGITPSHNVHLDPGIRVRLDLTPGSGERNMKLQLIHQKVKTPHLFPDWKGNRSSWSSRLQKIYREAALVLMVIIVLIVLMMVQLLLSPYAHQMDKKAHAPGGSVGAADDLEMGRADTCSLVLVESIPEGMHFGPNSTINPSIFDGWMKLLSVAEHSVDIASFYWTMQNNDTHTSEPTANQVRPRAKTAVVDMRRLTDGVLHTKFWIVDRKHVYIGSANMDWRSLTQVKELGAVIYNCSSLAEDLGKIFEEYWTIGGPNSSIPSTWPSNYSTSFNEQSPMELDLDGTPASVYFSSSPLSLCSEGRTDDLTSILSIIDNADQFVYVAVMNYIPVTVFSHPQRYWPEIDRHLRKVAFEKRVKVNLLISCWPHSNPSMFPFLRSLAALSRPTSLNVEVRIFVVPSTHKQRKIPYSRVNHNKYMVTDKVAYIGRLIDCTHCSQRVPVVEDKHTELQWWCH